MSRNVDIKSWTEAMDDESKSVSANADVVDRHPEDYDSLLRSLHKSGLFLNNCIKTSIDTGRSTLHSSPFVAALAARILYSLPRHPTKSQLLESTELLLRKCCDEDGLFGFMFPNYHRYDLDTQACVYSFLCMYGSDLVATHSDKLLSVFESHRSSNGAYLTWVGKPNDRSDFMVNLNIGEFMRVSGISNPELETYLEREVGEFLARGSYYYPKTQFALLLASFYYLDLPPADRRTRYGTILERITGGRTMRCLYKDFTCQVGNASRVPRLFSGSEMFRSKDSTFSSPILESLLTFYFLDYNRDSRLGVGVTADRTLTN